MLSFIRAMETFEVPVLLGLPAKVFVFSNRIYAAVQYDYPVNYGLATSLGVSFVALTFGLILMQNKLLGGKSSSSSPARDTSLRSSVWVRGSTSPSRCVSGSS